MNYYKTLGIPLLAILVLAVPAMGSQAGDCLPAGETRKVTFTHDPTEKGMPTDAEVLPNSVEGWEKDFFSPDDPLGPGEFNQSTNEASVTITNTDGKLSGPNGVVQNGGLEGDCIEVYVRYQVRYKKTKTTSWGWSSAPDGVGIVFGVQETFEIWETSWWTFRRTPQVVCPC